HQHDAARAAGRAPAARPGAGRRQGAADLRPRRRAQPRLPLEPHRRRHRDRRSQGRGAVNKYGQEGYLVRHGETEWTLSGQHTGSTDIPLTENGQRVAREVGEKLKGLKFAAVISSPMSRAIDTARLAGFEHDVRLDDNLKEWD